MCTHSITVAFPSQTAHFHILVATSSRQAPPPTQILCHPAATNCDASVYISTTHLSIVEHSRLTIGSPRVASLQHISVHFQERKRGHALQFAGAAPANSYLCRPNDPRCQPSPRAPPKTRSSPADSSKHPAAVRPATYEAQKQHSASTHVNLPRGESPVTYQRWAISSRGRL